MTLPSGKDFFFSREAEMFFGYTLFPNKNVARPEYKSYEKITKHEEENGFYPAFNFVKSTCVFCEGKFNFILVVIKKIIQKTLSFANSQFRKVIHFLNTFSE